MKKKVLFILIILLIPFLVKAEECATDPISVESITVVEKSENVSLQDENDTNVNVYEKDDYVKYKVVLKNETSDEYVIGNDITSNSNYMGYYMENEDGDSVVIEPDSTKTIIIKALYNNEVPDDKYNDRKFFEEQTLIINASPKENNIFKEIINPKTTASSVLFSSIALLLFSFTFLKILKSKRKLKYIVSVLIMAIPFTVFAICTHEIKINTGIVFNQPEKITLTGTIIWDDQNDKDGIRPQSIDINLIAFGEVVETLSVTSEDDWQWEINNLLKYKNNEEIEYTISTNSINGYEVTLDDYDAIIYHEVKPKTATFDMGISVVGNMKSLVNGYHTDYSTDDYSIECIKIADELPEDFEPKSHNIVSSSTSEIPIYIWYEESSKTIYYYSEADELYLNPDSSDMFLRLRKLKSIEGINDWIASNVTNMQGIFAFAGYDSNSFKINISDWDVSNVTSMQSAFTVCGYNATTWEIGDLSNWDVSKVTTMLSMFDSSGHTATSWSVGDISHWNTSSLTMAAGLFSGVGYNATSFSLDLSGWDVSKVTNMEGTFSATGHNSSYFEIKGLENWDVSKVTIMVNMFAYAGNKSSTWSIGDLSKWNPVKTTNMQWMFNSAGEMATNWKSIGTLNVYASNITSMFMNCKNAKLELNIHNNPSNRASVFFNAATGTNAGIVVNYKARVSSIDAIISTKSSASKVSKGIVIE